MRRMLSVGFALAVLVGVAVERHSEKAAGSVVAFDGGGPLPPPPAPPTPPPCPPGEPSCEP